MKFSVLLSVYYKEKPNCLKESLSSIFKQRCLPNEVILVEDGPLTCELNNVISEFLDKGLKMEIVRLAKNQGLGKALNEGLKHCSYDLVARMDTDDIAKPDRFEKQITAFRDHPELEAVGAWIDEFEGDDVSNIISIRKLPEHHSEIYQFAKKRNPINHPVVMFRKKAVLAVGGYQNFPFFEDYDLWVRMLLNGARFYNIQESLLYFRFSSDMFKRRGGLRYIKMEISFQNRLKRFGFISITEFLSNILIRLIARIIPNSVRGFLYKKALR